MYTGQLDVVSWKNAGNEVRVVAIIWNGIQWDSY